MRWFQLTVTELIGRLIWLNQDRSHGYSEFASVCRIKCIQRICEEMAGQSNAYIDELLDLLKQLRLEQLPVQHFSVSSQWWEHLYQSLGENDVQQMTGILYKMEDQFAILYKLVYNMTELTDEQAREVIYNQYEQLMKSKSKLPHLLVHYN